jgi:hypothetical protein
MREVVAVAHCSILVAISLFNQLHPIKLEGVSRYIKTIKDGIIGLINYDLACYG